ncbi:hypothetical protein ASN18_2647 [Candidatus Magnetominusculus xianensis]|uniref:Uncharacterized protein n=2 Tax=Candidatus Magnetominusculus xianensis TaxID=1748249 RepID=A0ABR5SGB7_9BACT|nr:hypothetical protein ASN18_2647 [Candidatus Magnetominusculus xianensis]
MFRVFTLCDTQLRTTFGGVAGMDWNVVMETARALRVELSEMFFRLLRAFEHVLVERLNGSK